MYMANDEQNHLAKCITQFKSKTNPQHHSNLEKVNESVLISEMTLLKRKKYCLKHLKVEYFQDLNNQNNHNN